ncbi:MAG: hypothetical protein WCH32_12670 [Pseudomonadota bacterium]
MISQSDPVRIFVGHVWEADDDYLRVFEYLESARHFYYANSARPEPRPPGGREAEREELRRQIVAAEAVIIVASHHRRAPELIEFQARFARSAKKPVILLMSFGGTSVISRDLQALADTTIDWSERALIEALRRYGRNEQVPQWDTIEFKLD